MPKAILSEGYGLMPNLILFDNDLSSTARLVLCYLMSLSAATGYCRPRNKHVAEKFNIKTRQVTNVLQELTPYVYISEDDKGRRILSLAPELTEEEGGSKKLLGGTQKIAIHSNNNSTNKNITSDLTTVKKVYEVWLKVMVVDPEIRHHGTLGERSLALHAAARKCRLTQKRIDAINRRLADAGEKMLLRAILALSKSDFHRGENDSNWAAKIEWLCGSYEKVEEWSNKYKREED